MSNIPPPTARRKDKSDLQEVVKALYSYTQQREDELTFVQELVANGVSVNGLDMAKNTPLHWAARGGHAEVVKILLEKNAAVNSQNKMGDTPLHLAAYNGNVSTVIHLLNYPGIDPTIKNKDGSKPSDLSKNDDVGALLLQFGASNNVVVDDSDDD
ncbi:hypothetical protein HK099_008586 [Clydaea vesicula]|uniref:Uncharacterized protein n=1 Tax=Clydaea vesicula TaxID=447962 RepID=A0AAD5Y083_9FUNG|nr:hypothetical protein HK099_008586 [Clydaea vesicula]